MRLCARPVVGAVLALSISLAAGCGGSKDDDEHEHAATGAVCPTSQTLTYASFGKGFFDKYCQRCHASTVSGSARGGAPTNLTYDTVALIRKDTIAIDAHAAAGPNGTNTLMPPTAPKPTAEERQKLGEWLACGAPE